MRRGIPEAAAPGCCVPAQSRRGLADEVEAEDAGAEVRSSESADADFEAGHRRAVGSGLAVDPGADVHDRRSAFQNDWVELVFVCRVQDARGSSALLSLIQAATGKAKELELGVVTSV